MVLTQLFGVNRVKKDWSCIIVTLQYGFPCQYKLTGDYYVQLIIWVSITFIFAVLSQVEERHPISSCGHFVCVAMSS